MRIYEKMDKNLKKSLVWACLYDFRYVRAGKVTASYFKALEVLLNLIIIEEGGQFKDAEECVISLKCRAWGHKYYSSTTYNSKEHSWQGPDYNGKGTGSYLGWNLFRYISEPNTSLIDWLASIDAVAFYLGQDSCWIPCEMVINGVVVWEEEE